ncbi:glucosaminidase domain-containing protein [Synechococcus sp. AH-601-B19]|nr:glucosaminidase domain-containing protein [Synechococcus sp. AH-601-B19]
MANFIKAGNIAVRKAVAARKALADNKADLSKLGKEAIKQDAYNVGATVKRNSDAAILKTNVDSAKKEWKMKDKRDNKLADIKKGERKAGMLAAGVGMLGVGAIQMNKPEEPNEELALLDSQRTKLDGQISDQNTTTAEAEATLAALQKKTGSTGGDTELETAPVPQGDQSSSVTDLKSAETSFQSIVDMARTSGAKYPELVGAQWALESGRGKTPSGKNNYFGIKATDNEAGTSKPTWEVENGQEVNTTARFKDFDTPQGSVDDLVGKWHKNYGNYTGVNSAGDARSAADMLVSEKYATDPNYASKLKKIMSEYGY